MTPQELATAVQAWRHGDDGVAARLYEHFQPALNQALANQLPRLEGTAFNRGHLKDKLRDLLAQAIYSLRDRPEAPKSADKLVRLHLSHGVNKLFQDFRPARRIGKLKLVKPGAVPDVKLHRDVFEQDRTSRTKTIEMLEDMRMAEPEQETERQLRREELEAMLPLMLSRAYEWGNSFEREVIFLAHITFDPAAIVYGINRTGVTEGQVISALKRLYWNEKKTGHRRIA